MEEKKENRNVYGSENHFVVALIDLLRKKEYAQITVTELCRQAGLARQTFYKYFEDKDALLDYMANGLNLMYFSRRDYNDRAGFFKFWYEMREVAEVLIDRNLMQRVAKVHPQTIEYVQEHLKCEGIAGDAQAEKLLFEFINAGEVRLLECWKRNGWKTAPEELSKITDILLGSCSYIR